MRNRKKRIRISALALASLVVLGGSAFAAPASTARATHGTLTIRHQLRGCHSWSFNGGRFAASQTIAFSRGGTLTIVDNDVMPHRLIQVSGPHAAISGAAMRHMSAKASVRFTARGTYRFTTKAGEDYMKGMKTIGEDNVLRLTVKVT